MAQEKKITKVQICVLMEMEDYLKAERVYGKEGDSRSEVIQRIIHDLVKDVKPTKEELDRLNDYYKSQLDKRMEDRAKKQHR